MSSLGSILSIARTAMAVHQTGVQVASQNIANAEAEGYHRQRVDLSANFPQRTPIGSLGTGVRAENIGSVRNALLDDTVRRESASASGFGMRRDLLGQVESIFGEPSQTGLASTLDAFWSSWSGLSSAPSSGTARVAVQHAGDDVASTFRQFSQRLSDLTATTGQQITDTVSDWNSHAKQVAALNSQIVSSEANGHMASDLRDARDRELDAMSKLGAVRVIDHPDGGVSVLLGTDTVVDGSDAKMITTTGTNPPKLTFVPSAGGAVGVADGIRNPGGKLGALIDTLTVDIPRVAGQLDALAAGIVGAVNGLHATGWTAAGGTGVAFFDVPASGVTATTMSLSAPVAANAATIAAGSTVNATGDNGVALALSGLRTGAVTIGASTGKSINQFYSDLVADVGFGVSSANASATVHDTLVSQAQTRRSSETGVSVDEELISVMKFQQAFQAASRLVNVADQMAQTVLSMVGG